jgi:hypothetical protein
MSEKNKQRARERPECASDRLYLMEAMRFLEDARRSWRALAVHWSEVGDSARAADALDHVRECELQRNRLQATIAALDS